MDKNVGEWNFRALGGFEGGKNVKYQAFRIFMCVCEYDIDMIEGCGDEMCFIIIGISVQKNGVI